VRFFSFGDIAATVSAAVSFYAVRALFAKSLVPLPAEPFAVTAACAVFCGVKAAAAMFKQTTARKEEVT